MKVVSPDMVANSFSLYHFDKNFIMQTKTTETPIPMKNLPMKTKCITGDSPKSNEPRPLLTFPPIRSALFPKYLPVSLLESA